MKRPSKNIGIAAFRGSVPGASGGAPGARGAPGAGGATGATTPEHTPKAPKIDGGGGTGATNCTGLEAAADSGATGDKELMPFRRQKTRDASALRRRKTVEMEGYLQTLQGSKQIPELQLIHPSTILQVALSWIYLGTFPSG